MIITASAPEKWEKNTFQDVCYFQRCKTIEPRYTDDLMMYNRPYNILSSNLTVWYLFPCLQFIVNILLVSL